MLPQATLWLKVDLLFGENYKPVRLSRCRSLSSSTNMKPKSRIIRACSHICQSTLTSLACWALQGPTTRLWWSSNFTSARTNSPTSRRLMRQWGITCRHAQDVRVLGLRPPQQNGRVLPFLQKTTRRRTLSILREAQPWRSDNWKKAHCQVR